MREGWKKEASKVIMYMDLACFFLSSFSSLI